MFKKPAALQAWLTQIEFRLVYSGHLIGGATILLHKALNLQGYFLQSMGYEMRLKAVTFWMLTACLFTASQLTLAVVDLYEFENEQLRERYNVLVAELRCPKCQNQNLAGSDSPIAKDLRRELHRMLQESQSDDEIKSFMVARYGDYVLYRPEVKSSTYLLWLGPFILLAFGALGIVIVLKQRSPEDKKPVDIERDSARLKQVLEQAEKDEH